MRLRFTPRAVENIQEIAEYLHRRSPSAARKVRTAIYDSLQTLLMFPASGRVQTIEGVRKCVTSRFGYLIFYVVDIEHDEVTILSVRHPAQHREHDDA